VRKPAGAVTPPGTTVIEEDDDKDSISSRPRETADGYDERESSPSMVRPWCGTIGATYSGMAR
jgi:hypothetical protein